MIQQGWARIVDDLETRAEGHRANVVEWAHALQDETEKGAQKLGAALGQVSSELAAGNQAFLKQLGDMHGALSEQTARLEGLMQAQAAASEQQSATIAQAVSQQLTSLQGLSGRLAELTDMTDKALAHQTDLRAAIQQLHDPRLEQTLARLASEIGAQNHETRATAQALNSVVTATHDVLA